MSLEYIFTDIYNTSSWGSKESRSGPASTLERTTELREQLPQLFETLGITSVFDAGCGDWNWISSVNLSSISYIGADIVTPLIEALQGTNTSPSIKFQKMNILVEPPETMDLWLLRDVANLYSFSEILILIEKFLESESRFLAITNIETSENIDGLTPSWRPIDFLKEPFNFPQPIIQLDDGQQWFRKKKLLVYSSGALEEWNQTMLAKSEAVLESKLYDKQDRNSHLTSNVSLRSVELRGHKV